MKFKLSIIALLFITLNAFTQTKTIEIEYQRNKDNSVDFFYKKSEPGSYLLSLKFKNVKNNYSPDYLGIISGNSGKITTLKPFNINSGISFSYTYSYIRGIPNPEVDKIFTYLLPFSKGNKVLVRELSFIGSTQFGNELPKNWKAYQFISFDNDSVFAARKGLVIDVIDQYELDTTSYFTSKKNEILVEHADGTYGSYSGFDKNGTFVKKGQMIYPQTPLGILGKRDNTLKISEKRGSATISKLNFKIYFLIDTSENREETLFNHKSRFEYVTPLFYSAEGPQILKKNVFYTADYDEKTLLFEYSRKELKKRAKGKR